MDRYVYGDGVEGQATFNFLLCTPVFNWGTVGDNFLSPVFAKFKKM